MHVKNFNGIVMVVNLNDDKGCVVVFRIPAMLACCMSLFIWICVWSHSKQMCFSVVQANSSRQSLIKKDGIQKIMLKNEFWRTRSPRLNEISLNSEKTRSKRTRRLTPRCGSWRIPDPFCCVSNKDTKERWNNELVGESVDRACFFKVR